MSARVSIVIPTFNRARLLPRAIDSSLAQTEPAEVIVCDHGSTDDTPAVAAAYGSRIRYVRREQDQGPIVCWRDGVEHASGEYIHLNFDDDWIDASFVERTLPLLGPDVAFVYTRTRIHEPDNPETKVLLRHPAVPERFRSAITAATAASRRTVFLDQLWAKLRDLGAPGIGVPEADGGGGKQSKKIDLKAGKYTFYCDIAGHRAQGMEGTLTVT